MLGTDLRLSVIEWVATLELCERWALAALRAHAIAALAARFADDSHWAALQLDLAGRCHVPEWFRLATAHIVTRKAALRADEIGLLGAPTTECLLGLRDLNMRWTGAALKGDSYPLHKEMAGMLNDLFPIEKPSETLPV
jgi:hypothetical protein